MVHSAATGNGEEDYVHVYVHGLHPKIAESVAMQDPKTLDDAMRMTLTADAIIHHAVRVNPHRRVFNDTNILPMELGAWTIRMPWHAGPGPAKRRRARTLDDGGTQAYGEWVQARISCRGCRCHRRLLPPNLPNVGGTVGMSWLAVCNVQVRA